MAVPLASSLQLHCSGSGLRDKQSTTTAAKARPSTSRAHCTTETTFVSLLTKPTRAERSTAVSARDSANIIKQISSSCIFRKQTQTKKNQEGSERGSGRAKTTARGNVHSLRATCGHKSNGRCANQGFDLLVESHRSGHLVLRPQPTLPKRRSEENRAGDGPVQIVLLTTLRLLPGR